MSARIVFVGGIHGVGKTTYCRKLAKFLDADFVSASDLIERNVSLSIDKSVANPQSNQEILLSELANYQFNRNIALLDGHWCLMKPDDQIFKVPIEVFRTIDPALMILLTCDISVVQRRLLRRGFGQEIAFDLLNGYQRCESHQANVVADALSIKLLAHRTDSDNEEKSFSLVSRHLTNIQGP